VKNCRFSSRLPIRNDAIYFCQMSLEMWSVNSSRADSTPEATHPGDYTQ
jgi:hypothetical protein